MRRIAYIPARGGSKGVPRKNIREVSGKPLIAYSIEAARETGLFEMVFVSTDSQEIADIAVAYGAEVPFLRYPEFARDTTKTIDTMVSDAGRLEALGRIFDVIVLLQPTSPLRRAEDIAGAVSLFESRGLDCGGVVSVSAVEEHPLLMRTLNSDGTLKSLLGLPSTVRRQDMPAVYRVNGAIYVNAWKDIVPTLSLNDNPVAYVMEPERAPEIDTLKDLKKIERILLGAGHDSDKE